MSDDMPQGDGSGSDGRANPAFEHSKEGDFWAFCFSSVRIERSGFTAKCFSDLTYCRC